MDKRGGGGGWYFLIPYTAPIDRIIFYDCVEQYPFVAKGSYDSFYLTPPLLYRVVKKKVSFGIFSIIESTYDIDFFTVKITGKILSLSKF